MKNILPMLSIFTTLLSAPSFSESTISNLTSPIFSLNFNNHTSLDFDSSSSNLFTPRGFCIGGKLCGKSSSYLILFVNQAQDFFTFGFPTIREMHVNKIRVFAHDNVGDVHKAHLLLRIWKDSSSWDKIYEKDVKKDGSWLEFSVNRKIAGMEFMSINEDSKPGGDETMIMQIESN